MSIAEQLLLNNGEVWDIGQLDAASIRWLKKATKAGLLYKARDRWCGLKMKTVWRIK